MKSFTKRPDYSHKFVGVDEGDELKFKKDPSIRASTEGLYGVLLDNIHYQGTNHAANAAFRKIGERERTNVKNGWHGPRNWIHLNTGKSLFQLYNEKCISMGFESL